MSEWKTMDTVPMDGTSFLGYVAEDGDRERFHICQFRPNVKIVGSYFHFDRPPVIAWQPLPEPPAELA